MAQLTTHANWKSVAALTSMFTFLGLLVFALAAGTSLGIWLYAAVVALIFFGFWSKEDHLAIVGIMGFWLLIILDIILRVGVLAFNECHATFSILTGC